MYSCSTRAMLLVTLQASSYAVHKVEHCEGSTISSPINPTARAVNQIKSLTWIRKAASRQSSKHSWYPTLQCELYLILMAILGSNWKSNHISTEEVSTKAGHTTSDVKGDTSTAPITYSWYHLQQTCSYSQMKETNLLRRLKQTEHLRKIQIA